MTDEYNRFKFIYENIDEAHMKHITAIRNAVNALSQLYTIHSREMSIAFTKLEESSMWALKAVCMEAEKQGQVNNE